MSTGLPFFSLSTVSGPTAEEAALRWRAHVAGAAAQDGRSSLLHILTEGQQESEVRVSRPLCETEALLQAALHYQGHQPGTLLLFPARSPRTKFAASKPETVPVTRSQVGIAPASALLEGLPQAWQHPYRELLRRHPLSRSEVCDASVSEMREETALVTFSVRPVRKSAVAPERWHVVPTVYLGKEAP